MEKELAQSDLTVLRKIQKTAQNHLKIHFCHLGLIGGLQPEAKVSWAGDCYKCYKYQKCYKCYKCYKRPEIVTNAESCFNPLRAPSQLHCTVFPCISKQEKMKY